MTATYFSSVRARRGHFALESGHHGDLWLDLETLCRRPAAIEPFASQLAERLRPHGPEAVCGPLNEGAFVALMVARRLDCDFTYAERFVNPARDTLFPVEYRLPAALHGLVRGKRVAIVNDVISAGSAVRGTFADLDRLGARVVAIGALLVLGDAMITYAREREIALETLEQLPYNLWTASECPLCRSGAALDTIA